MKRIMIAIFLFLSGLFIANSQVPEKFNYQGTLRNSSGELIKNSNIKVQISLLEESTTGNTVFIEQHDITTNDYGQFAIKVGEGTNISGSISAIDWASGLVFLKTEIDETGIGSYTELGLVQLITVPYALYSKNADFTNIATKSYVSDSSKVSGTSHFAELSEVATRAILADSAVIAAKSYLSDSSAVSGIANNAKLAEIATSALVADSAAIAAKAYIADSSAVSGISDSARLAEIATRAIVADSAIIAAMAYYADSTAIAERSYTSNLANGLGLGGVYSTNTDTLFVVKDHSGNVVFAVFPDGAQVIVNEAAKGKVGGFAISGRSPTKALDVDILKVTADSTRVYVNDTVNTKGKIGGFAVSGRSPTKNINNDLLLITADSTRVYVNNDPNTKGKIGGFAISGRSPTKATTSTFMDLTSVNYFIGHKSGTNISTGTLNSALGYESGVSLTTGSNNAYLGYQSGYSTISGSGNLFLGYQSGFSNVIGNYNTFLGYQSGYSNIDGKNNSFLGSFAGKSNTSGSYNTFVGDSTGFNNTFGGNNTFLGTKVGYNNTSGWSNAFIGNYSGYMNQDGAVNVFIGNQSGYSNVSAGGNVYIGHESGYSSESGWNNVYIGTHTGYNNLDGQGNVYLGYYAGTNNIHGSGNIFIGTYAGGEELGSNKLFINDGGADSSQTFIWGDMSSDLLRFNAKVGIGTHPENNNLSISQPGWGSATLSLIGRGDLNNYSVFKLEADDGIDTTIYQFGHDLNHKFNIVYYDRINWQPRLGIDSLGGMMIGDWGDATEKLDVAGNARFRYVGTSVSSNIPLYITSTGVLSTAASDIRLKTNIENLGNNIEKVLKLQGVRFNWKSDIDGRKSIGFIAQDVEKVIPELVFTNEVDGYKGVNYAEMTAVLVEAIKEQQSQIINHKSEIETLKSENQELKQKLNEIIEILSKQE